MKILNRLFKPKQKIEKHNLSPIDTAWDFGNMYDYFTNSQNYLITKILAVSYYTKCSPLYNAVDMIATAISSIPPQVYDKEKEIWISDHPVLELLKLPNADISWEEFIYALVSFYIVTGDSYSVASGKPGAPPKELYVYPSQAVTLMPGKDGFVQTLQTSLYWGTDLYMRDEIDNRFRYYNSAQTSEIWHIKHFNPTTIQGNIYGMSPLNPIYYEINQHQSANRHNLSILERGVTPGGVFSLNPPVDDDVFTKIQEQMDKTHAGAANAGRAMILNWGLDYKSTGMTNKDMDFLELKKEVTNAIYKNLKIPLALVNTETMTLDNMTRATLSFYDHAVLPIANRVFSELSNFLMPRYSDDKNLILSYNAGDITALEPRRNEQLKVLKDLDIYTRNELRAKGGSERLLGAGIVYGQSGQVPVAVDPDDQSPPPNYGADEDEPEDDDIEGEDDGEEGAGIKSKERKSSRAKFTEGLRAKVDHDGKPLFTEEEIAKLADKHELE